MRIQNTKNHAHARVKRSRNSPNYKNFKENNIRRNYRHKNYHRRSGSLEIKKFNNGNHNGYIQKNNNYHYQRNDRNDRNDLNDRNDHQQRNYTNYRKGSHGRIINHNKKLYNGFKHNDRLRRDQSNNIQKFSLRKRRLQRIKNRDKDRNLDRELTQYWIQKSGKGNNGNNSEIQQLVSKKMNEEMDNYWSKKTQSASSIKK